MTTGRINQVTITVCTENKSPQHSTGTRRHEGQLSTAGVRYKASTIAFVNSLTVTERIPVVKPYSARLRPAKETPCSPISQVPGPVLPVQRTEITAFSEDYQQPAAPEKLRSVTAYLLCSELHTNRSIRIGKQSTSFLSAGITSQRDAV